MARHIELNTYFGWGVIVSTGVIGVLVGLLLGRGGAFATEWSVGAVAVLAVLTAIPCWCLHQRREATSIGVRILRLRRARVPMRYPAKGGR